LQLPGKVLALKAHTLTTNKNKHITNISACITTVTNTTSMIPNSLEP
jgi:hypothetical protein